MKCSVKDCDLGYPFAQQSSHCQNSLEIIGIVERGEFAALLDSLQNLIAYHNRFGKVFSAMHYPVANRVNVSWPAHFLEPRLFGCDPANHKLQCGFKILH